MQEAPDYVGLIADAREQPVWVIQVDAASRELAVKAVQPVAMPPNSACELWLIDADGRAYSLGMLPEVGTRTLILPRPGGQLFKGTRQLKVTLEPPGGSPTEQPSGPVLYEGMVLTLG
jgi:anti-sigma-K factor RskA